MIELDGTPTKSRLGANAILAVSLAAGQGRGRGSRVAALPPPRRLGSAAAAGSDDEHHQRRRACRQQRRHSGVHDCSGRRADLLGSAALGRRSVPRAEGCCRRAAWRPRSATKAASRPTAVERGGADVILEAIEKAGFKPGKDILLALDVASSEFYKEGRYELASEGKPFDSAQFVDYLAALGRDYPIVSIEDGLAENDWDGWEAADRPARAAESSWSATICSSPTPRSCSKASRRGVANSILIKPNQIGTLTETLAAIAMADEAGYSSVISHRSGETEDTIIADLASALRATQIKTGSLCRSDRVAKYNRLLLIEAELGPDARFAGPAAIRSSR